MQFGDKCKRLFSYARHSKKNQMDSFLRFKSMLFFDKMPYLVRTVGFAAKIFCNSEEKYFSFQAVENSLLSFFTPKKVPKRALENVLSLRSDQLYHVCNGLYHLSHEGCRLSHVSVHLRYESDQLFPISDQLSRKRYHVSRESYHVNYGLYNVGHKSDQVSRKHDHLSCKRYQVSYKLDQVSFRP